MEGASQRGMKAALAIAAIGNRSSLPAFDSMNRVKEKRI